MKREFYLGTYASPEEDGILRVEADFGKEQFTVKKAFKGIENPSWIAFDNAEENVLYCVNERTPDGGISAFRIEDGELVKAAELPTGGSDPCHISFNKSGKFLSAANYTSGSLSVFILDENGIPVQRTDFQQHEGKGVNPARQEGPHVHFSQYHKGELYCVDLGLDTIFRYTLDKKNGKLTEKQPFIHLPEGNGPRHFVFSPDHPDRIYILTELTSSVFFYEEEDGEYKLRQKISALPTGFDGENTAAAIRISADGKYLFTSNRGDDSIAQFRVRKDGKLELLSIVKTGGRTPRDIALFGHLSDGSGKKSYLIAANQDSRELTALRWNEEKETLEEMYMKLSVQGNPVCILPVAE